MKQTESDMLPRVIEIAVEAGKAALKFYGGEISVEYKADHSPLTRADKASHEHIVRSLKTLGDIPVLSEESDPEEIADRKEWSRFWLVDPLDGTKEFVKKTGQFTVNIALVEKGEPVLGVVHVPVSGITYFACRGTPPRVRKPDGADTEIRARCIHPAQLTIVASRDHAGPRVTEFIERIPEADVTSMGSSLKFCLIAEGKADFYPRVVPTMEWDTGAAQCIVEAAGGGVTDLDGHRLTYNKDDLRNPSLMAFGDPAFDWVKFFAE